MTKRAIGDIEDILTMLAMVFVIGLIVWATVASQNGCSPCPEKQIVKEPIWLRTNYFRDPEGLCFAYVKDYNQIGLTFIPDHRCPMKEDKREPANNESSVP